MDVYYPALVSAREVRAQYAHVAREDYQVILFSLSISLFFFFNGRLTAEFFLLTVTPFIRLSPRVRARRRSGFETTSFISPCSIIPLFCASIRAWRFVPPPETKNGDFSFVCFHFSPPPIRVSAGRKIPPSELPITTASMNSAALNEKMPDAPR